MHGVCGMSCCLLYTSDVYKRQLLKRAAGIAKGSGVPNKDKVGKVTLKQIEDIAKQKMPDLNAASIDTAVKSIRGTARSMGIEVVG